MKKNIKIIQADLLNSPEKLDFVVHGCNCWHTMGAGLAAQVAKQFPEALRVDRETLSGEIHKWISFTEPTSRDFRIVNLYTQYWPGKNFQLSRLEKCLVQFYGLIESLYPDKCVNIGFPKIGAGIGGGDWEEIFKEIEKFARFLPKSTIIIHEL